ncbi:DNA polymerase III subunit delta [Reichenbachiella carrageenanivorans]|uniref:DNA polymerase III subunit delta n=1 Tax=Reichenbachiella carrageenanivorans TaxID=2979869 RepID=A0ABY6D2A9_9BACT|nr:DNA polymerase III subunit delta [Reichenbachiella carrageenanivorans]UXX80296.1 DNA polymerase III subunit delta [Reichenbachiella carrageenanivorans]
MRFADIPGLSAAKAQLIHAIKGNHVAHAQLFYGKEGSANMALALAYATYINCKKPTDTDSCGTCESCAKTDKLVHPDLQFVFPVSATKSVTGKNVISSSYLKEWRTFLNANKYGTLVDWSACYGAENKQANISKEESRNIIKSLTLKAFEAEYKVMIIWLPEYMNVSAANGILKILEEPAEKTLFLLVTCEYEKLLTTILSRCQLFKVPSFSDEELQQYLEETKGIAPEKAKKIAALAEGSLAAAVENIDSTEDDAHVMFRDWMRQCWVKDFTSLNMTNDSFSKMSKTGQKLFLQYALNMMRQALVSEYLVEEKEKLNEQEKDFAVKFGKALSTQKLEKISEEFSKAHYHLERNANVKILFLDLSLSVGRIMTAA